MSRDTTSKYRLEITCKGFYTSPMSWKGLPTRKRLVEWVDAYEASCLFLGFLPGGVNAHLGAVKVDYARIYVNDGGHTLVAEYIADPFNEPGCGCATGCERL